MRIRIMYTHDAIQATREIAARYPDDPDVDNAFRGTHLVSLNQ
jgi:hypothetical protein